MNRLELLATEVAEKEGCLLYDLEFTNSGGTRTLRIYIDKKSEPVGLEDCSNVSKGLNLTLDTDEDIIPGGAYSLEVSTPGLERSLKKPWHFEAAIGKKISLRLKKSLESFGVTDGGLKSAKQLTQEISRVSDVGPVFLIKEVDIEIPFEMIEKAKIVFEFNSSKPNKKR